MFGFTLAGDHLFSVLGQRLDFMFSSDDLCPLIITIWSWFTIASSHSFSVWSEHLRWIRLSQSSPIFGVGQKPDYISSSHGERFILFGESFLFSVGETVDIMLISHDIILSYVTMKVRMMMMMECIFKVSNDEDLKNVKCQYHTHEVSANNGSNQVRLAYNDF